MNTINVEALTKEIAAAIGAKQVRWVNFRTAARIEVPRDDSQPVSLVGMLEKLGAVPAVTAVLGLSDDGSPVLVRLKSPEVRQVLISGDDEAMKTGLLQSMIVSLAALNSPENLKMIVIDPKAQAFGDLLALPHLVHLPISNPEEAASVFAALVSQIKEREQTLGGSEPRVILAIDHLDELIGCMDRFAAEDLSRILVRGSRNGIHVIASSTYDHSSFPVRVLGNKSKSTFQAIADGVNQWMFRPAIVSPEEMRQIGK